MNKKLIVPGADRNKLPPSGPAKSQLPVKKKAAKK